MASSWRVFFGAIARPGRTFAALAADPKRFRKGFRMMLIVGVLYAAAAALLAAGGALVTAPAIIPLPPQNYYFFQMIFALPFLAVLWLLSSTFAFGLSRLIGGRGAWKTTAAGLAYSFAMPCLAICIPQTVFGILLNTGMPQAEFMDLFARPGRLQTGGWAYHGLAVAWMIGLSIASLRAAHGFRRVKAVFAAVLASALFLAAFLVCIR
jgi:hypothetical protein